MLQNNYVHSKRIDCSIQRRQRTKKGRLIMNLVEEWTRNPQKVLGLHLSKWEVNWQVNDIGVEVHLPTWTSHDLFQCFLSLIIINNLFSSTTPFIIGLLSIVCMYGVVNYILNYSKSKSVCLFPKVRWFWRQKML